MNYNWIDKSLLDGIDYFSGVFYFFLAQARKLGYIIACVAVVMMALKLIFGTTQTRKAFISTTFNFVIFFVALEAYNPAIKLLADVMTGWGLKSGNAKGAIEKQLSAVQKATLQDLEVAKRIKALDPEGKLAELRNSEAMAGLAAVDDVMSRGLYGLTYETTTTMSDAEKQQAMLDIKIADEERKNYASSIAQHRTAEQNIVWAEKRVKSIEEIFKPQYDKDGKAIAGTYFLSIMLKKNNGDDSSFLSPSALLRVAIFTASVLMTTQTEYMVLKMDEGKEESAWYNAGKYLPIANLSIDDIAKFILAAICAVAVILACIFALVQYVMCVLEYTIIASIGIIFVPFIIEDSVKQVARKILPALMAQGLKLMIITLCLFFSLYQFIVLCVNQLSETSEISFTMFGYIAFTIIVAWVVTQNAPKIMQSILTGQPQLSTGEFMQALGTAGAVGIGAAQAAKTAGKATGKGVNALGTGLGMVREGAQAAAQTFKGVRNDPRGSTGKALMQSMGAVGDVAKGHLANGAKNLLHKASHLGGSSSTSGGSQQGKNRFDGKEGAGMQLPDANTSSFKHATVPDGAGGKASATFGEYMGQMKDKGSAAAKNRIQKFKDKQKETP